MPGGVAGVEVSAAIPTRVLYLLRAFVPGVQVGAVQQRVAHAPVPTRMTGSWKMSCVTGHSSSAGGCASSALGSSFSFSSSAAPPPPALSAPAAAPARMATPTTLSAPPAPRDDLVATPWRAFLRAGAIKVRRPHTRAALSRPPPAAAWHGVPAAAAAHTVAANVRVYVREGASLVTARCSTLRLRRAALK